MSLNITSHGHEKTAGDIRQRNEKMILAAAEQEFAAFGFKGASMREIANRAELPKANIHYYFKNKLGLYLAVLSDIIDLWDGTFSKTMNADDNPAEALPNYIRKKIEFSYQYPLASRIFATEIISGGPNLEDYFSNGYAEWFESRVEVFREWQRRGKISANIDPAHLIFLLWSSTQHYADFHIQIASALGKSELTPADFDAATDTLTHIILTGCGVSEPGTATLGKVSLPAGPAVPDAVPTPGMP
ncbi:MULTISPECIES: TetR/AcrR family transcriptional regulator [unclassified Oceanobacter]|uniref:TetR/AcrR family transcriptional regulator n=1 Tax=unclassified Oceanobacter TaxID=2620260 RepID=UPI0026E2AA4D|nr:MULTISPECIES: TetR/AcrR family transcriptional regulator [unclassified Oceanobacter]MDO6683081.1 TetR/AcrR family transcriptional regulator [Oceanobacter sp. 5_MG-2023]MDP2505888.1 TetR/AcrR family transcriptional regulator [Oceanobacter sp. 3_MG-2023]